MLIEDSEPLGNTAWRVASLSTAAMTLHAIFNQSPEPIAFGVKGELDNALICGLTAAIEATKVSEHSRGTTRLSWAVNGFDYLATIRGADRHFLQGWTDNQREVIHVVPVFGCERTPEGDLPEFERFKRLIDIFDLRRVPEPFFRFHMHGGKSQLHVDPWGQTSYLQLRQFIKILSNESDARLVLQNRSGAELPLPSDSGWEQAGEMVAKHLSVG